jgi:hypothetical protein
MALSGVHVACGYAGGVAKGGAPMPVIRKPVWSESPASNTPSTNAAPANDAASGDPLFAISTSAAIYVSIGLSPNASVSPRIYVRANDTSDPYPVYVSPGDKFAWVAA